MQAIRIPCDEGVFLSFRQPTWLI